MTRIESDVPQKSLQQRLLKVAELLELMANRKSSHRKSGSEGNPESLAVGRTKPKLAAKLSNSKLLHELRVACRRSETALSFREKQSTSPESKWLRQRMHEIRKACNPLRDDEVFLKWLERQSSGKAQRKLVASVSKSIEGGFPSVSKRALEFIEHHTFQHHVEDLSSADNGSKTAENNGSTGNPTQSEAVQWRRPLGRWLFQILERLIHDFPKDTSVDFKALHQLRIRAKRLRYSMEFASEVDPRLRLAGCLKLLEEMQEKLGEVHDSVIRQKRIEKEHDEGRNGDELIAASKDALQSSLTEWQSWWQPAVWKQLLKQSVAEISKLLT